MVEAQLSVLSRHCLDLSLPEEQLYQDFERLMGARRRCGHWSPSAEEDWGYTAGMYGVAEPMQPYSPPGQPPPGGVAAAAVPPAQAAQQAQEDLAALLAGILQEHGGSMTLMALCNSPGVSEARKGIARDMNKFFARFAELFAVEEDPNTEPGQPKNKVVTLVGEPPAPSWPNSKGIKRPGPDAWNAPPMSAADASNPNYTVEVVESKREELLRAILELVSANGGQMCLDSLGGEHHINEMKRGVVRNLTNWFTKSHSDLFELFELAEEGKPPRKMVRLLDGWEWRLSESESPAKRARLEEAPAAAAPAQPPDPEATEKAVEELAKYLQDRLTEGPMKLEQLAVEEPVREIRKNIPKRRKLGEVVKSFSQFEIFDAPVLDGAETHCPWVRLAMS